MKQVSAYVPCFNNEATVARAVESLQRQSVPVAELFVVDDGSTDSSRAAVEKLGVRVVTMKRNAGRGPVRARAMDEAQHEFVVCCDATNTLPTDFVGRALKWFDDPKVAGAFGRIWQERATCVSDRWRGRHLFKVNEPMAVKHGALLSTWGCVMRKSAVMAAGNFDQSLRHTEDAELGSRLVAKNFDVVFDPELHVISVVTNSLGQVLERHWRWYAGVDEEVSLKRYAKQVWYSMKVMAMQDLRDGDALSVPVSLFSPHYQFWKSWARQRTARAQK
ncbi:MAG: glycosyltransferase [Verrucomicrobia bacterium]|nr:glycosyltransferase [Verrucomicrobiota bacterium]